MSILMEAMKNNNLRVSSWEGKWMVVSSDGVFAVYQRRYKAKQTKVLIETTSEREAVEVLCS